MSPEPKVNILLVDDRPENLLALEAILDAPDYHLVRATSGREALKCMLDQEFALILLDVQMPGMDGFETARLIKQRERSRDIPIIFVTAVSKDEKYIFEGYATGAVDYLLKPFHPAILRSKVAVFVDLYRKTLRLEQIERETRVLERLSLPATDLTAVMFDLPALSQARPDIFNELSLSYGEALDLEQRAFKVEHDIPSRLRILAGQLGFLNAGPRDVVEVHVATLKEKAREVTPQKMGAYVMAGRFLILELLVPCNYAFFV
ncbi:MAG: response regulator [Proteobacteria bacterium]|nr:response regulator [Pseudomonadota bacterium]MBU4447853.1 response regulator [Pseudomonadota bacterium]